MSWAPTGCLPSGTRLLLLTGAAGCVVLAVLAAVLPAHAVIAPAPVPVSFLIAAGAVLGWVAVRVRAQLSTAERSLWTQLAVVPASTALAALTTAVLAVHGYDGTALVVPGVVATLVGYPLVYSGLLTWNRTATRLADPHEMLNGLSALCAVTAAVVLLLTASGYGTGWAVLVAAVPTAAAFVLVGTAVSVATIAATGRDRRTWLLAAGFAPGGIAAAVGGPGGVTWAVVASGLTTLAVGCAAGLEPRTLVPQPTDPIASSIGGHAVLVVSVGLLVTASLGDAPVVAAWLAGAAACGAGTRLFLSSRDLAQLETMREEARTDELTGLANRRAVLAELDRRPVDGRRRVVALVDLDRFKEVNDSLGHAAGDALLRAVAARLTGVAGHGGLVGRLGGDEFAIVGSPGAAAAAGVEAAALGAAVRDRLAAPFDLHGSVVHVRASIGLTVEDEEAGTGETVREADVAMYHAKRSSSGVELYDAALEFGGHHRLTVAEELREALQADQLVLHYQPQVQVPCGRVVGVEALVRWQHPVRGLLPPSEFLEVAELHGLVPALTDVVLARAVAQLDQWWDEGNELRMSVNLSASALQDAELPRRVGAMLDRCGLPPAALVMEVTETTSISGSARCSAIVSDLAARGIGVSLDDFGTGWSSLTYLRELPATELKIDRSFTGELLTDRRVAAIVAHTVGMAHALGLRVVAEGVEDEATFDCLAEMGCDESQGYLHSPALPAADLVRWQRAGDGVLRDPVATTARR